jgi:hypothetical protein
MATPSIFTDPLVINVILPFLLVFVVTYAILQKTGLLGPNKQANIIVSLIIGFIFIGVPSAVGVTLNIIPVIAVVLVILLCFMLIFGFSGIDVQKNKGLKIAIGIILGLTMIGIIIWATGVEFPPLTEEAINYIIIFGFIIGAGAAIISAPSKPKTT